MWVLVKTLWTWLFWCKIDKKTATYMTWCDTCISHFVSLTLGFGSQNIIENIILIEKVKRKQIFTLTNLLIRPYDNWPAIFSFPAHLWLGLPRGSAPQLNGSPFLGLVSVNKCDVIIQYIRWNGHVQVAQLKQIHRKLVSWEFPKVEGGAQKQNGHHWKRQPLFEIIIKRFCNQNSFTLPTLIRLESKPNLKADLIRRKSENQLKNGGKPST